MHVEEPGGPDAVSDDPDRPVYQVEIFTRLSEPAHIPEERRGFSVAEWKLHDVEIPEALSWAAEKAAGRPYTVAVASVETGDTAHLLHLFGVNPVRSFVSSPQDVYTYSPDLDSRETDR